LANESSLKRNRRKSEMTDDERVRALQRKLHRKAMEEDGRLSRGKSNRRGTPQGRVISPLSANVYLNRVDKLVEHGLADIPQDVRIVRQAGDFVPQGRPIRDRIVRKLNEVLAPMELELNAEKTKVGNAALLLRKLETKGTGRPYAGKPHVRFDEGPEAEREIDCDGNDPQTGQVGNQKSPSPNRKPCPGGREELKAVVGTISYLAPVYSTHPWLLETVTLRRSRQDGVSGPIGGLVFLPSRDENAND